MVLSTDDEKAQLQITVAVRGDTGLYTTTVSNELGQDTLDTYVIVLGQ